jgi:hypothetical protein
MAFPNLILENGARYHASAEGVPANGNNVIGLPFDPVIINENRLVVDIWLSPSVTDAEVVSVDPENARMTVNFTQIGTDSVKVEARIRHSSGN